MFKPRRGRDVIDASIAESMNTLEGISDSDKNIIYEHITEGLDLDIDNFESQLSLAEKVGPPLWEFLHWMGKMADKENDPSIYTTALSLLVKVHPCSNVCRKHLASNLKILPITSYTSYFDHSIDLHNLVNRQLSKDVLSRQEAYRLYDMDCDTCVFSA